MEKLNIKKMYKFCIVIACIISMLLTTTLPLYATNVTTGTTTSQVYKSSVTYAFTDGQLRGITAMCIKENSSSVDAIRAEASLMANLNEREETPGDTASFIDYITRAPGAPEYGWFSSYYAYDENADVDQEYFEAVKDVLVNGNRFFPPYVDEHDWIEDIVSVSNNGVEFDKYDYSQYIKDVTVIVNNSGATYTFFCFPDEYSDPFGYIDINTNSDIAFTPGTATGTTTNNSPYKLKVLIDDETRTFKIYYPLYDEERAEKLKQEFEKYHFENLYQKLLEKDNAEGIEEDQQGRLAILAAFLDNGLSIKDLTEESIEYIPEFLEAELISSYPDLREKENFEDEIKEIKWQDMIGGEFQGIVRLKRREVLQEDDGTIILDDEENPEYEEIVLEYLPLEDFEELEEEQDIEILEYFTMDEECKNIIVAVSTTSDGTSTITRKSINYKPATEPYAMKFELLEAFLIVGNDTKLSQEMIDLAYGGTIQIGIFENVNIRDLITKTTIWRSYRYRSRFRRTSNTSKFR